LDLNLHRLACTARFKLYGNILTVGYNCGERVSERVGAGRDIDNDVITADRTYLIKAVLWF